MPTYTGTLHVCAKSTDFDSFASKVFDDELKFKADPEIFDLTLDRNLKKHGNAHNLPVDPVSIALAASMGINWKEVVASCAVGDDSVAFRFEQEAAGWHTITLPATHPALNGATGKEADLIHCNNQSARIMVDGGIGWRCMRVWPDEGGNYSDKGAMHVPRDLIPLSALAAFQGNIDAGTLTLDQIIMLENVETPAANVRAIEVHDEYVSFYCDFPADDKGCSSLA